MAAMDARAPDGVKTWAGGRCSLAHGMLFNTPESRNECQPLASPDGRFHMVWDGRLDNREDLRRELMRHGGVLRDDTDPEIVLQLYSRLGDELPHHLVGDFAFIVFDSAQNRLFCARDHVGARPLHYVVTYELIAVASTEESLATFVPGGARPNIDRVVYALVPALDDFDWSNGWIDGVKTLMPGTQLSIDSGATPKLTSYWSFEPQVPVHGRSRADACAEFSAILERATRDRMRADGPLAMMLSGGIDSACVAGAAHHASPDADVTAYSVVSDPGSPCVETDAIHTIIERMGWPAQLVQVPSLAGLVSAESIRELAWQRPHPVDNSILLVSVLCQLASSRGHRVMLHGATGDLSFLAPDHYIRWTLRERGWQAAMAELRIAPLRHVYLLGERRSSIVVRELWRHLVPAPLKAMRRARRRAARALALSSGLSPDVLADRRVEERLLARWARNDALMKLKPEQQHVVALRAPGVLRGLAGYDRAGAARGLELRDPLADIRLLKWLQSSPLSLRVCDGQTKWIGRDYVRQRVAASVADRVDKTHLGWHLVEAAGDAPVDSALMLSAYERNWLISQSDATPQDAYTSGALKAWLKRFA